MNKKIGLIINPAAGLGGSLAYKGSDGLYEKLLSLGAVPKSHLRGLECLEALLPLRDELLILTGGGGLGGDICRELGFKTETIYHPEGLTTREDTIRAAKAATAAGVELLLFAGGDGTARDIYEAVGENQPALGIPAGVKIHSGVYAQNPRKAGMLAKDYLTASFKRTKLSEVMDIDEDAFRRGKVSAKLYGYLKTPYDRGKLQSKKSGRTLDESSACELIALHVTDNMQSDVYYVIGSGTTTKAVKDKLDENGTLLGVDIFLNKKLVTRDADERKILETIGDGVAKIIVTPIGGQGHIFGRGNQQLSPAVIKSVGKENIIIISTVNKIAGLRGAPLLTDSGEAALDKNLEGYVKIITGYNEFMIYRIEA